MPANIVHVLSSFKVGGAERFVLDLAKVQMENGERVLVYATSTELELLSDEAEKSGVIWRRRASNRVVEYLFLLKWFFKPGAKVLHLHSPAVLRFLLPLLPIFRLLGGKIVYTRHGIHPLTRKEWTRVHALAKPFVNKVTFVSQAGLEVFKERFAWAAQRLQVVPNGIYIPEESVDVGDKPLFRLGSVGRMVALKGQKHLIEATEKLQAQYPDVTLEIHFFGDGPVADELKQQASASSLPNERVVFHGMQLDRDFIYSNMDLLVVCSEQEGMSIAIMEAMARAIPCVATNVGDSPKLVIDEQTGHLFEYSDVARLTELLAMLQSDRAMLQSLGSGAREHISTHFSLSSTAEHYQHVYFD